MSDLSRVLGDLYGEGSPDAAPVRKERSAKERMAANENTPEAETPAAGVDEDLAAVLSEALATAPAVASSAAVSASVKAAEEWADTLDQGDVDNSRQRWTRGDDDILPTKKRGGVRFRRSR